MANLEIPIAKAGKDAFLSVDTNAFDEETYAAIVREGLKVVLNAKMTKVGAITKLSGDELAKAHAKALEIAQSNLEALTSGNYKFPGTKAKAPESREVQNEALRLARDVVKDQLKAHRITISHVPAKQITEAARLLVQKAGSGEGSYIAKAKENLAARSVATPEIAFDLEALGLKPDADKVAKAEAAKAKRSENLSAKQAGMTSKRAGKVAGRSKPGDAASVLSAMTSGAGNHATHSTH